MGDDQGHGDLIDSITGFAMRQASRRGFIKWLAKGGIALAAGMTAGIELLTGTALASENCQQYYPGCEGECTCATSECQDPSNGKWFYCSGICNACPPTNYYVDVFWYWSATQNKCIQAKNCILCYY
ncbi:MAG: hypothetical protein WCD86_10520 [Ktedonobacteraceae bacterium]